MKRKENKPVANGKQETVYDWEEIRKHRSAESAWVVIKNGVYDVTNYLSKHPGGAHTLLLASGQDVTYLFETSHTFVDTPRKILEGLKIGVVPGFVEYSEASPFYDELKIKVKAYFDRTGQDLKDPIPTIKVALFLLFLWVVGYYYGFKYGSLWAAGLMGVSRALFGINTMHASSHFAVSHKPWVWQWLDWFVFDILMGGSSLAWNYQHIVGHHQHTNVFQADPDFPCVVDGDMRRVVKEQTLSSGIARKRCTCLSCIRCSPSRRVSRIWCSCRAITCAARCT